MPSYKPVARVEELPEPGKAIEHETMDFKERYNPQKPGVVFDIAKDLAMFANHLGGTLLVGADAESERSGYLVKWTPLRDADAADMIRLAESAARECRPSIRPSFERIKVSGGEVVAINIEPTLIAPVAIPVVLPSKAAGKVERVADAYKFPIRRGSTCDFITPEALPMFMDAEYRKTVVLLNKVGPGRVIAVYAANQDHQSDRCKLVRIDPELNVAELQEIDKHNGRPTGQTFHTHIDGIQFVFQTDTGRAMIRLKPGAWLNSFVGQ